MPEEDTAITSEASTPDEGQVEEAATTSEEVTEGQETQDSPEETTAPEESKDSEDKAEGELGKFKSVEDLQKSYSELESKLGNYKELEEKAKKFDEVAPTLEKPPVEEEPDMDNWTPEQIVDYRAEKKARGMIDDLVKEKLEPLSQDYYGNKAKQEIAEVKQTYPDFDKYEDKIKEIIAESPGLVRSAGDLVKAYKVAKFDDASKDGEQKAYEKLKEKKEATPAPTTSDKTVSTDSEGKTIAELYEQAESELRSK